MGGRPVDNHEMSSRIECEFRSGPSLAGAVRSQLKTGLTELTGRGSVRTQDCLLAAIVRLISECSAHLRAIGSDQASGGVSRCVNDARARQ